MEGRVRQLYQTSAVDEVGMRNKPPPPSKAARQANSINRVGITLVYEGRPKERGTAEPNAEAKARGALRRDCEAVEFLQNLDESIREVWE